MIGSLAIPAGARIFVDVDQIGICTAISNAAERLDCFDGAIINTANSSLIEPQPTNPAPTQPTQPIASGSLISWAQNPNLPDRTRLAAQVLNSSERTAVGGYPIAIVDSETHQLLAPPQSPLEDFMRSLSDETVAATKYTRDFYFSIPSSNSSSESAILGFSCERNITNMHVHFAKQFPDVTNEVGFMVKRRDSGSLDEITSTQRFIENGYVMEAPRGLVGIDLIKRLMQGDQIDVVLQRNGEPVVVNFNIQDLNQPMSILARQCSWSV